MNIDFIILAAGKGTRMGGDSPKVLVSLAGKPMIQHLVDRVDSFPKSKISMIVGYKSKEVINGVTSSNKISLESEVRSINQSIEKILPNGNDAKTDRMFKLREFPTWPAVVNTSVLVDPKPNSVVIDIGSIIEEISNELSEFQISKLFTCSPIEADQKEKIDANQKEKTNSYQAEAVVDTGNTYKLFDVQPDSLKDEDSLESQPNKNIEISKNEDNMSSTKL